MAAGTGLLKKNVQADPTQDPNYSSQAWRNSMPTSDGGGVSDQTRNSGAFAQIQDNANMGRNQYFGAQQQGPYRGGFQTSFNFNGNGRDETAFYDQDADERGAANAAYEMAHPTEGTDMAATTALNNMYKGRLATKNSLAETIAGAGANERKQEDILTGAAGEALGQGLKNTRQNYNSRGLLYSGIRQGGEQKVKQGVASGLDASISETRRESANSVSSAQNAYAAVDLANAQESLNLAHQAFDTASQNNIARLQAMQQLGSGVGAVAGYAMGTYGGNRTAAPAGPSGPSYYDTSATNNYFDSPRSGLLGNDQAVA